MSRQSLQPVYSQIRDYSKRIEAKFGDQKNLRYTPCFEWHHLSKRNSQDPYEDTGYTGLNGGDQAEGLFAHVLMRLDHALDFGSGDAKSNQSFIFNYCEEYTTVDSDPSVNADFLSIEEIGDRIKFDGVIAQEVFEHIGRDDITGVVSSIADVMESNGIIVATMPNVLNACYFLKDYDHKNPMKYNQLGALFSLCNIEVIGAYLFEFRKERWDLINFIDEKNRGFFELCKEAFGMHPAYHVAVIGLKRDSPDYRY